MKNIEQGNDSQHNAKIFSCDLLAYSSPYKISWEIIKYAYPNVYPSIEMNIVVYRLSLAFMYACQSRDKALLSTLIFDV